MMRLAFVLLLLRTSAAVGQAPVPMHQEPRHRLVLTHRQVKVMDVRIDPGDTTLFHVHSVPSLYVAVAVSPVDVQLLDGDWNGTPATADPGRKPGDVNVDTSYARQPVTHRVTNVGSRPFNLIAVTNWGPPADDRAGDDMPGVVELRNRWFAQSRARISAGTGRRWYPAPSPTIVVHPFGGSAEVLLEDGEKHVLREPGAWALVPAGTRYRLSSPSPATLVVVRVR